MSGTVFRYVVRLYLAFFGGAMAGALLIFLVGDLGDRWEMYVDKAARDVAALYANKAALLVQQLGPVAMLLAAGGTVSTLRKRGEWLALQSVGASRWVVVLPISLCAALIALGLTTWDELVTTRAGTEVDRLLVEKFNSWGDYRFHYVPKRWFRVGDFLFNVRGERDELGTFHDVTVLELDHTFRITTRYDATTLASAGADRWNLTQVIERRFAANGESPRTEHSKLSLAIPGTTPETFALRTGRPEYMRVSDLRRQQALRARLGLGTERYQLVMHNRFAYPLTGVAATLLALSLGLRRERKGHLTVALVEGLIVVVALFSLMLVAKRLALSEVVPAAAAAWGPACGLFLAVAVMWLRAEGRRSTRALGRPNRVSR